MVHCPLRDSLAIKPHGLSSEHLLRKRNHFIMHIAKGIKTRVGSGFFLG